ncbi:hypothetical protein HAZT_HAZT006102 [Hyalella azteca]|uniref:inositol-phosphate phosphatase n=1 Tax=Hyalella azteca TaxID=294128 RepID=A0A6A0GZD2_HYAAZ|nr:hypothetical protein HAZT_HAZT006102 [Hyalella azteca]
MAQYVLGRVVCSVRSLGSAALHMCMVAEGAAEGSVSLGLFAWDKAAAVLIVQEAGGVVLDNAEFTDLYLTRALGSAALDMCLVAEGAAEVYWENGLHAWDMAASVLLITEAGGVVLDITGGPHDLMNRRVLCAASPQLAQQMVQLLEVYDEDRD